MEKQTVLEIEFKQVWDKWAWRITKNELFNLHDEVQEYENKTLRLKLKKECKSCIFMYSIVIDEYEEIPNCILLEESEKERLEEFVKRINEKYGKPKRWRAEEGGWYYSVNISGRILRIQDGRTMFDDDNYNFSNYFQTEEQAEKARELQKKAYQEVWRHE
ncbi:hypothetical protein A2U03_06740 [Fusobacterium necrophorum subsp. funduliforme]|uniref:hypothetical protein n=1 Tax=Fusobacterium necrophorum TaxID=859 RepID=UPI000786CD57|nr:hypothetical protein [Fusobacterium necrophorum]KYM39603.1 hypothetical protein A2U03_06740 [Fusobacterium necrophorum subsp. funduliforme]